MAFLVPLFLGLILWLARTIQWVIANFTTIVRYFFLAVRDLISNIFHGNLDGIMIDLIVLSPYMITLTILYIITKLSDY